MGRLTLLERTSARVRSLVARRSSLVLPGYRRLLVPVAANPQSDRAIEFACRLAAERRASITAVAVIEVSPQLPLDAHMIDEEDEARRLLERAAAVGDSYGVTVSSRILRARDASSAIVEEAAADDIELLVIGVPRKRLRSTGSVVLGSTVEHVLRAAACRVMVVAEAPEPVQRSRASSSTGRRIVVPGAIG